MYVYIHVSSPGFIHCHFAVASSGTSVFVLIFCHFVWNEVCGGVGRCACLLCRIGSINSRHPRSVIPTLSRWLVRGDQARIQDFWIWVSPHHPS